MPRAKACESCRFYEEVPHTAAPNPLLRGKIRRGGFCSARADEVHPFTGVPNGRDLVDAGDWCPRFEEAA